MAESYLGGHSVIGNNSNALPRNTTPPRLNENGPIREQAKERDRVLRAKRIKADRQRVTATAKAIERLSKKGQPIGFNTVEKAMNRAADNTTTGKSMASALAAAIKKARLRPNK